ncbi:MAG: SnoaL-like domain-containing protein [Bacteroidetes bacterium]|jgi:predicted SnoaL-like aldol condensation-catalyzing enzyme|nr:SnoaL-like domain-containing protein [Bacteroidota bacterium]MBT5528153.1 SnoaL-like domain-containing protein [Cytophagia bacterium]MBT6113649.1 SnoaL-like domain-containing protein [Candidatus Neomarinimicrobiota bacterium]MBT3424718.1 SnoaL-like domain-containing protein [Bacteroidota bacterium]MBT3799863.1 SnoaL-like domain-containing protein [Bacteroidota bacterium]
MNLEQNKKNAIAFYKMAYEGNPEGAIRQYIGEEYIQHNPDVEDGTTGFVNYFNRMQKEYPDKSIEFVRCIAEGDLVALHTHQIWPENDEYITMDFFRFNNKGKICEHWDSIQQIPKKSANPNKMY